MRYFGQTPKITISLLLILTMFFTGCEVPDIQPFSNATTGMVSVMRQSNTQSLELWKEAENSPAFAESTRSKLKDNRKKFQEIWKPTEKCLTAIASYTDSLVSLAEAGKTGKESAQTLFDSIQGVLDVAGGLKIPTAITGIVATLNGQLAKARARGKLKDAVIAATQIIDGDNGIASILEQNFAELGKLQQELGTTLIASTKKYNEDLINYHDLVKGEDLRVRFVLSRFLRYKNVKFTQRQKNNVFLAEASVTQNQDRKDELELQAKRQLDIIPLLMREEIHKLFKDDIPPKAIKDDLLLLDPAGINFDAGVPRDRENEFHAKASEREELLRVYLDEREAFYLNRNITLEKDLIRIKPRYDEAIAEIELIDRMLERNLRNLSLCQNALTAWKESHRSLRVTLETKQKRPSLSQLLLIISDITSNLKPIEGEKK
jgi:hypothetical protein